MIPAFAWPDHIRSALKEGRFEYVLAWLDNESPPRAGLLKAAVYDWSGKPLDAIDALTRALKSLAPQERAACLWYRGLLYIQAAMPALAEQDFDVVLSKSRAHPSLTKLARAYAKVLLGDARGALDDIDGLPHGTTLALDRIVTPAWIENYTTATLRRGLLKEETQDAL